MHRQQRRFHDLDPSSAIHDLDDIAENGKRLRADRPRESDVFGHVEPPLLGLIFRHEGLPPADARSQLDLRNAGILARLDERLEQGLVEFGLG